MKINDIKIPKYLQETIDKQKALIDKYKKNPDDDTLVRIHLVWNEVYVDINHALSNDAITEAEARALRDEYLGI